MKSAGVLLHHCRYFVLFCRTIWQGVAAIPSLFLMGFAKMITAKVEPCHNVDYFCFGWLCATLPSVIVSTACCCNLLLKCSCLKTVCNVFCTGLQLDPTLQSAWLDGFSLTTGPGRMKFVIFWLCTFTGLLGCLRHHFRTCCLQRKRKRKKQELLI